MAVVSMKQFIEAGVHFGHQTRRWNPKMRPFIFGAKNGIHIIDLQKSLRQLKFGYEYIRDLSAQGETVLFVGTKPQARDIIQEEAERSGGYFINERWLGGLLTNFNTIKQSVSRLKKIEEQRGEDGLYEGMIKKEAMRTEKSRVKLERALGGIKEMRKLPGAIFLIDCKKERIALLEAQKLGIPVVAVVDTNCDPDNIDVVIPGNDDAIRAIRLFAGTIGNAVLEGRALYEAKMKSKPEEDKSRGPRRGAGGGERKRPPESAALPSENPAAAASVDKEAAPAPASGTPAPEVSAPDSTQPESAVTAPAVETVAAPESATPAPAMETAAVPAPAVETVAAPSPVKAAPSAAVSPEVVDAGEKPVETSAETAAEKVAAAPVADAKAPPATDSDSPDSGKTSASE